jgi:hypothetical protein
MTALLKIIINGVHAGMDSTTNAAKRYLSLASNQVRGTFSATC